MDVGEIFIGVYANTGSFLYTYPLKTSPLKLTCFMVVPHSSVFFQALPACMLFKALCSVTVKMSSLPLLHSWWNPDWHTRPRHDISIHNPPPGSPFSPSCFF
ncbi:hypothetical protein CRENBAI_015917 [Crenichthys baileyi]|uniref:Uncharacterized protein n=1 Tax=Crenichthys baileyi TaxID=28760 RepID=A0AAV9SP13_9TELE